MPQHFQQVLISSWIEVVYITIGYLIAPNDPTSALSVALHTATRWPLKAIDIYLLEPD